MISFNIERVESQVPGKKFGRVMQEEVPGSWYGSIGFTVQPAWCAVNETAFKLWESDGSGANIKTVNNCHKTVCSSAERRSYYPFPGQQIFDTDLNKMLICINPDKNEWVDFLGQSAE